MLLTKSYLNKEKTLIKLLEKGKYGVWDTCTGSVTIAPKYDYIFHVEQGRAAVLKEGRFFEIDMEGNECFDKDLRHLEMFILKGDSCPGCDGGGCRQCQGFGFIPLGGIFDFPE